MTDRQLEKELIYLEGHCVDISTAIHNSVRAILIGLVKTMPPQAVPLWKRHEDHQACTDRIQAIVEELNYRAIP